MISKKGKSIGKRLSKSSKFVSGLMKQFSEARNEAVEIRDDVIAERNDLKKIENETNASIKFLDKVLDY